MDGEVGGSGMEEKGAGPCRAAEHCIECAAWLERAADEEFPSPPWRVSAQV